jgi:hypothetical protein
VTGTYYEHGAVSSRAGRPCRDGEGRPHHRDGGSALGCW